MDLRYERTERSLMEACLELGKSKPIRSLTVKEVTQKAQINRITFYSHYSDINELADHIEDLAIQEWLAYLCPVTDYLYKTETFIRKSLRYADQCRLDGRLMPPFTEAYNNRAYEALSRQILAETGVSDSRMQKRLYFALYGSASLFHLNLIQSDQDIRDTAMLIQKVLSRD